MEIKKAKHQIETTNIATDHRLIRDRWLNIKRILDAIYKQLSPLKDDQQTISINNDSLTIEQEKLLPSVLEKMRKDNIINSYDYKTPSVAIATTVATSDEIRDEIRKFSRGEDIMIESGNIFENYRKEISEFCNFIEKDGKKRFPKVYKKTFDKTEIIKQLIEEVNDLDYYKDFGNENSNKIYKIEQKFKMIVRKYFDNNVANYYIEEFRKINFYSLGCAIVYEDLHKSNFNNNKKKLLGLLNVILDELNLENNIQGKKENINTEHSQKNTKDNKLADTIYNNGSFQINNGNNNDNVIATNTTDEKNKPRWWEKTWVQILMLLGAMAGIVGLLFLN